MSYSLPGNTLAYNNIFFYVKLFDMKKRLLCLLILLIFLGLTPTKVAAKVLPRFKNTSSYSGTYSGITVYPYLRADRQALLVNFGNLNNAVNVSYMLIYQTNGKDEGVSGSLDASVGNSASRELLFGTCSSGVCRYHPGLTNMRFEVTYELTSGRRYLKRYRVKV